MPPEEGIFYEPGFITSQGSLVLHQAWELEGVDGKDMCGAGKQGEGRPQGLGFSMKLVLQVGISRKLRETLGKMSYLFYRPSIRPLKGEP